MTVKEARQIAATFESISAPTEEDIFLFTEAMDFLIREQKRPEDMVYLGGWYYEQRDFDLALKYYEMASAYDFDAADECLGYIWYYGRTGERDFERAFRHFSKSMERGNPVSTYKVADMYKNGYFVAKDCDKYKAMIEKLHPEVRFARYVNEPLPEIFTRLARIRTEEGKIEEAVDLYLRAKRFLAQRIRYNPFFGNLNIMKWLIDDLYELIEFDPDCFDFYDLYYVLKKPAKVRLFYGDQKLEVESVTEEGACAVRLDDKWFRDRDAFFQKAMVGGKRMTEVYDELITKSV